ncbi:hypothetical protein GGU11DRAFT_803261 [Lentinula aff. detonsa]|nr:hypothetical protein GGU11DRAFT_803261 [Lentinula aff. detonsa]
MSVDGEGRASFMDADKSDEARGRFIKRIKTMFDENGRELSPNLGIGRNAIIPPVPKIPRGLLQGSSSKTWIWLFDPYTMISDYHRSLVHAVVLFYLLLAVLTHSFSSHVYRYLLCIIFLHSIQALYLQGYNTC